jgi:CRP-like cAMP-binding protein/CheY-like chemotaxis protein
MPKHARANHPAFSIVLAGRANETRQTYGDYFTTAGCRVTFATDSDTTLAQSLSLQPDAITITNGLRPLNGPQLCARLKTDVRTAAIPVIVLTTSTKAAGRRAARAAGCAVQLLQPVTPQDLFRTVQAAVTRAEALQTRASLVTERARRVATPRRDANRPRRSTDLIPFKSVPALDGETFLDEPEHGGRIVRYQPGSVIYRQGDTCDTIHYVKHGVIKLSVVSNSGHEAIVGLVGPGDFFGEGCLTGQPVHLGSATAVAASTVVRLDSVDMRRLLHEHTEVSDQFIAHMLERNSRVEADLVDQLFNSSERRLARALLLLARYGEHDDAIRSIPNVSQTTLAEMVGTTRSRINFFMRKFERLGFIEYKNGLKVNKGLLTLVLSD